MKKHVLLLLSLLTLSLVGCGTSPDTVENSVVYESVETATPSPEPTVAPTDTPAPTATPTAEPTATPAPVVEDKGNANDSDTVDGLTEEPVVTEAPVETPAPTEEPEETQKPKSDISEEDRRMGREVLGLTDEQLDNMTTKELYAMMDAYIASMMGGGSGGSSGGSSGSSGGSNSSGSSSSDDGIGLDESGDPVDPSLIPQLIPADQVLPGHM